MIDISLNCKCGKEIEITVPMFVDKEEIFICKSCFENKKLVDGVIATAEIYIQKLEQVIKVNQMKRKINDQLDLLIDDNIELLRELRITQKPFTEERKTYFLDKLKERQKKIHEISEKVNKSAH